MGNNRSPSPGRRRRALLVALAFVLLGAVSVAAATHQPHLLPWFSGWLWLSLLSIVAAAWAARNWTAGDQWALGGALTVLPLVVVTVGIAIVARVSEPTRLQITGEYRNVAPADPIVIGAPPATIAVGDAIPGWGPWRITIDASLARRGSARQSTFAITDFESVDFISRNRQPVYGLPVRHRSVIRVEDDSMRFLAPGGRMRILGRGPPRIRYAGEEYELRQQPDRVFGIDVRRGAQIGDLLMDPAAELPTSLRDVRMYRTGSGRAARFYVSHHDRASFQLDRRSLPDRITFAPGDELGIGVGRSAVRFSLDWLDRANGHDLLYFRYLANPTPRTWQLPAAGDVSVQPQARDRVIIATASIPGEFSLLELGDLPAAHDRTAILGRLERRGDGTDWVLTAAEVDSLANGDVLLGLPEQTVEAAGFVLRQRGPQPPLRKLWSIIAGLWAAAVVFIFWLNRLGSLSASPDAIDQTRGTEMSRARLFTGRTMVFALVPLILLLVAIRTVIAVRAAYLPPYYEAGISRAVLAWALVPFAIFSLSRWATFREAATAGMRHYLRSLLSHYGKPHRQVAAYAIVAVTGSYMVGSWHLVALFLLLGGILLTSLTVLAITLVPLRKRETSPEATPDTPIDPMLHRATADIGPIPKGTTRPQLESGRVIWLAVFLAAMLAFASRQPTLGHFALATFLVVAGWYYLRTATGWGPQIERRVLSVLAVATVGLLTFVPFERYQVTFRYLLVVVVLLVVLRELAVCYWENLRFSDTEASSKAPPHAGVKPVYRRWITSFIGAVFVFLLIVVSDPGMGLYAVAPIVAFFIVAFAAGIGWAILPRAALIGALLIAGGFSVFNYSKLDTRPSSESTQIATLEESAGRLDDLIRLRLLRTTHVRFVATYNPDVLERAIAFAPSADIELAMRRTLEQWWGMRSYTAAGWTGPGLAGMHFSGRGVTTPVALSDNAFAVFVLGENGAVGGIAVLWIFGLLFLLSGWSVLRGRADRGVHHATGAAAVIAIGSLLLVPALYIAAANAVRLPLTGQNVPLLAINSAADVFFVSLAASLLITVVAQFHRPTAESSAPRMPAAASAFIAAGGLATCAATGVILTSALAEPPGNYEYVALDSQLQELVAADLIRLDAESDTLAVRAEGRIARLNEGDAFLARHRKMANRYYAAERARAEDPIRTQPTRAPINPSVFATLAGDTGSIVHTRAQTIFGVRSPFAEERARWRGRLIDRAGTQAAVGLIGLAVQLILLESGGTRVIEGPACEGGAVRGHSFLARCGPHDVRIRWRDRSSAAIEAAEGGVRVNGVQISGVTYLNAGDIVEVPGIGALIVDEMQAGSLSRARWQNGRPVRVGSARFPLAEALAWRIDEGVSRAGVGSDDDVELTLDLDLSAKISASLATFADAYTGRPALESMSAAVLDAATGRILALAGWTGTTDAVNRVELHTCPDQGIHTDAGGPLGEAIRLNFTPHLVGSAIKPYFAAAALYVQPALREMTVDHPGTATATQIAGIPIATGGWSLDIGTERGCLLRTGGTRIDASTFLGCSSNLYAATLTFLAAAPSSDKLWPVLTPSRRLAHGVAVAGNALHGAPAIVGLGVCDPGQACRIERPGALARSEFAAGVRALFDVQITQPDLAAGRGAYHDPGVWRSLVNAGMMTPSTSRLNQIAPCVSRPYFDLLTQTDQLARFAIGAQENQWTNLHLAQGLARVLTGRRVDATMIERIGMRPTVAIPGTIEGATRWRVPVVQGLFHAVDSGTARGLQSIAMEIDHRLEEGTNPLPGRFRIAAKTGTLDTPPLKSLVIGAGLWDIGPDDAPRMRCGVSIAIFGSFRGFAPRIPDVHLEVANGIVLPMLRDYFDWDDPAAAATCYD